jgi:molybdopterin converting factor small subunit
MVPVMDRRQEEILIDMPEPYYNDDNDEANLDNLTNYEETGRIQAVGLLLESKMKVAIIPRGEQLKIIVNYNGETAIETSASALPGLYAPWPDAREKGFIELEVEGQTLRALLAELGRRYKKVGVDFEPICPITNDLKFDYDVFVNGKNYVILSHGLDAKLSDGDEVKVVEDTLGHC